MERGGMSAEERQTLKLAQIIEIGNINACRDALMGLRASGATQLVLDVEDLVAVDTAALQLLASFVMSVHACGGRVEWENLSMPLCQAACVLGLEEALAL